MAKSIARRRAPRRVRAGHHLTARHLRAVCGASSYAPWLRRRRMDASRRGLPSHRPRARRASGRRRARCVRGAREQDGHFGRRGRAHRGSRCRRFASGEARTPARRADAARVDTARHVRRRLGRGGGRNREHLRSHPRRRSLFRDGNPRSPPDLYTRRAPDDLARLTTLQLAILSRTVDRLKPGGRLVYAVCSVLREEGEDVVERLLAERSDLELTPFDGEPAARLARETDISLSVTAESTAGQNRETMLRLLPHRHGTDGYFLASLVKRAATC